MTRSPTESSWTQARPVSRAKVWSSSVETRRKLASPRAASSTSSRARRPGSWVAMPTGQRPESQMRYCWQPMAMRAAVPMATASAPRARALAKSDETRKPPVTMSDTPSTPRASSQRRARSRA